MTFMKKKLAPTSTVASKQAVGPLLRAATTHKASDAWLRTDPLGESLHYLRMDGVFYGVSEFSAPWGLALPPMPGCLMFHIVTAGQCLLMTESLPPVTLRPGTFALVPHGEGHGLASNHEIELTNLFDTTRYAISDRYELMVHGGGGEACRMICGAVRMDHPAAQRLVRLLPPMITVDTWSAPGAETIQTTLRLMASEVEAPRPGGEAVITRLADVLVIQALRAWMEQDPAGKTGWLGALRDPQIGQALGAIHSKAEQRWTVESLALEASMSRSAFSARFTKLVGETPMQYVRSWKMHVAAALLKDEGATVAELAFRFGYNSEAAFSRAFKKEMGIPPSAVKRLDQSES